MSSATYTAVGEDVFEAARRQFFSGENGKAATLNNRTVFTQTKTYDGPIPEHMTPKSTPVALTSSKH